MISCSLPVVSCVNCRLVEVVVQQGSVFRQSRWLFVRSLANGAVFVERKQDLPTASSAGFMFVMITQFCHLRSRTVCRCLEQFS